jgi:hypothetical protein
MYPSIIFISVRHELAQTDSEQIGQIPKLDNLLAKNAYLPLKFPNFNTAAGFCIARFTERMQNFEEYKDKNDFINGFLQAKQDHPNEVTDNEVIGYLIINVSLQHTHHHYIHIANAPNRSSPAQTQRASS